MAGSLWFRFLGVIVILSRVFDVTAQWPWCDDDDDGEGWNWFKPKTSSILTTTRTAAPGFLCTSKTFKQAPGATGGVDKNLPRPTLQASVTLTPVGGSSGSIPASVSWVPKTGNPLAPTTLFASTASSSSGTLTASNLEPAAPTFTIISQSESTSAKSTVVTPTTPRLGKVPNALDTKDVVFSRDHSFTAIAESNTTIELIAQVDVEDPSRDSPRQPGFAYQGGIWIPDRADIWFTSESSRIPSSFCVLNIITNKTSRPLLSHTIPNPVTGHYYTGMVYWTALGDETRPPGIYSVQPRTGNVHEIVVSYEGKRFNGPSDLDVFSVDGKPSALYFTDVAPINSTDLDSRTPKEDQRSFNTVYKFDFASGITQPLIPAEELISPRGICVSADQKMIYIAQAPVNSQSSERAIYSFSLLPNGDVKPGSKELFASAVTPGVQDGLKCDDLGNIWSAEGGRIAVRDAAGKLLGGFSSSSLKTGMATDRNEIANFALAGDQLIVLALDQIWRIRLARAVVSPGRYGMSQEA